MPQPIVQFKAGKCEIDEDSKPFKVKPIPTQGFIYLYIEEDLTHFCWRPRGHPIDNGDDEAVIDLMLFSGDARFEPWHGSKTNGRIYSLSFDSSSTRHFFWLQAKNQHPDDKPDYWSERDLGLGHIVNEILKGEDVDPSQLLAAARGSGGGDDDDDDEDEEMQDADGSGGAAGGAGAGATGGNATQEGEGSRRGGEDGARAGNTRPADRSQAPQDAASAAVAGLLASLQGNTTLAGQGGQQSAQGKLFTTLPELLQPSATLPTIQNASESTLNELLSLLPPQLLLLAQEADDIGSVDPNPETTQAALQALSSDQKKEIVRKVLRSPQFSQSLASLTAALRDGGLPTIGDALQIPIKNGGFIRHGGVPLGGGEAVEAFLEGIKAKVDQEQGEAKDKSSSKMETE